MTTDDLHLSPAALPPLQPADATTPQSAQAQRPPESAEFRRLLERLAQLGAAGAPPAAPADVDGFARALAQAEDDYVAAMDLRRRLEDAFRRAQP
jgi:hypothetical protein